MEEGEGGYRQAQARGRTRRDCTSYMEDCPLSLFNLPTVMSNMARQP